MANMGALGAIGGLGEGMLKRAESMEKESLMAAEEAKAKRLATFGAGLSGEAATTKYERDLAESKRSEGVVAGAAETKAGALKGHQDLERQSRLDVQALKNKGARATSANMPKWMKERFAKGKITGGQETGFAEVMTQTDNRTGVTYEQHGDQMRLSGITPKIDDPDAHARDMAVLQKGFAEGLSTRDGKTISGSEIVDKFSNKYKYLPIWVFSGGDVFSTSE